MIICKNKVTYSIVFLVLFLVTTSFINVYAAENTTHETILNKYSSNLYLDKDNVIKLRDNANVGKYDELLVNEVINDLNTLYKMGNIYFDLNNDIKYRDIDELAQFKKTHINLYLIENQEDVFYPMSDPAAPYFGLQAIARQNVSYLENYFNDLWELFLKYPSSGIMPQLQTEIEFACNVAEGQPWDYKRSIGWNNYRTCTIDGTKYYLTGENIGNIHYAYVGRSIGFSTNTLCLAGGIVQVITSKGGSLSQHDFDSYWDDPNDQVAIRRGASWYDTGKFK